MATARSYFLGNLSAGEGNAFCECGEPVNLVTYPYAVFASDAGRVRMLCSLCGSRLAPELFDLIRKQQIWFK